MKGKRYLVKFNSLNKRGIGIDDIPVHYGCTTNYPKMVA